MHYWHFGCDHKTACGKWEYEEGEKVNPVTDHTWDVDCQDCRMAYVQKYGVEMATE